MSDTPKNTEIEMDLRSIIVQNKIDFPSGNSAIYNQESFEHDLAWYVRTKLAEFRDQVKSERLPDLSQSYDLKVTVGETVDIDSAYNRVAGVK
jgi:hypothetical protein